MKMMKNLKKHLRYQRPGGEDGMKQLNKRLDKTFFDKYKFILYRTLQLVETNEFMQRDLTEFSQSVQNDASRLVNATASTMKEKLNINVGYILT